MRKNREEVQLGILVTVARKELGELNHAGTAHIDAMTPRSSIAAFVGQSRTDEAGSLEVYLISGEQETALEIFEAVKGAGETLTFSNIDRDGSRNEVLVVDRQGNIFYGTDMSLATVDPQELASAAMMRQIPNQPLSFVRH